MPRHYQRTGAASSHRWFQSGSVSGTAGVVVVPVSASRCVSPVNGLENIEVTLLAGGHADKEPIALNGVINALGVDLEHGLRALEGGVVECWAGHGAKDCWLRLGQSARRSGEERGREELDLGQVIGFEEFSAQAGAAAGELYP